MSASGTAVCRTTPRRSSTSCLGEVVVGDHADGWREACAGLTLSHMGRGPDEDPAFFEAAYAAGVAARQLLGMKPDSSRTAWEGKLLSVTLEQWGDNEREIVEHPGAVVIVAVDTEGQVALVRQLREATRKHLVELPAGTLDEPGEDAARRGAARARRGDRSDGRRVARGGDVLDRPRLLPRADARSSSPRSVEHGEASPGGGRGAGARPLACRQSSTRAPRRDRGRQDARRTAALPSTSFARRMKIGVVREIKTDEYRVALTPAGARELVAARPRRARRGGRGRRLGSFRDGAYEAVGARIASTSTTAWGRRGARC